jgi:hypothetical protein
VSLTGGAGFLASYGLLHAGMETLSWRYGLSVGIAYGFILLLLWLWLRTDVDTYDGLAEALVDVGEAVEPRGGDHKHCRDATSEPLVELPEVPGLPEGGAVRRTFVPFAITALLIMTAGWALSIYAPTARSLGEVLATR